jgi:hypothetical protein
VDTRQSTAILANAVRHNWPYLEADIAADQDIRHVSRLLRRASVAYPGVATHSLHLLCNKVGISPSHEYQLFCGLNILLSGESVQ